MRLKQVEPYLLPVAQWIISKYGCLTQEKFISDRNYLTDIVARFIQTDHEQVEVQIETCETKTQTIEYCYNCIVQ